MVDLKITGLFLFCFFVSSSVLEGKGGEDGEKHGVADHLKDKLKGHKKVTAHLHGTVHVENIPAGHKPIKIQVEVKMKKMDHQTAEPEHIPPVHVLWTACPDNQCPYKITIHGDPGQGFKVGVKLEKEKNEEGDKKGKGERTHKEVWWNDGVIRPEGKKSVIQFVLNLEYHEEQNRLNKVVGKKPKMQGKKKPAEEEAEDK
ncbi:hypothetical protein Ddc_18195 [Ditylenchus destructor]|nr:hypothetical protein Ddc_18195 [Ditylenchus destructor]